MKKIILVCTAILFSFGSFAQTDSTNRMNHDMDNNKMNHDMDNNKTDNSMNHQTIYKSHPDGVMMQLGKMMIVKNGKMTILDHDITMTNGTKVMSDGTCINKDGSKMMMKDGQHMDMSGKIIPMNDSKTMYLVPDSTKKKEY